MYLKKFKFLFFCQFCFLEWEEILSKGAAVKGSRQRGKYQTVDTGHEMAMKIISQS